MQKKPDRTKQLIKQQEQTNAGMKKYRETIAMYLYTACAHLH